MADSRIAIYRDLTKTMHGVTTRRGRTMNEAAGGTARGHYYRDTETGMNGVAARRMHASDSQKYYAYRDALDPVATCRLRSAGGETCFQFGGFNFPRCMQATIPGSMLARVTIHPVEPHTVTPYCGSTTVVGDVSTAFAGNGIVDVTYHGLIRFRIQTVQSTVVVFPGWTAGAIGSGTTGGNCFPVNTTLGFSLPPQPQTVPLSLFVDDANNFFASGSYTYEIGPYVLTLADGSETLHGPYPVTFRASDATQVIANQNGLTLYAGDWGSFGAIVSCIDPNTQAIACALRPANECGTI